MAGSPWDRRSDEPALWFERFERFLWLGAGRTIEEAWRQTAKNRGGKRPSKAWYQRSQQYEWWARAAAWDIEQQEQRRRAFEEAAREDKLERIRLLREYRNKLERALRALMPETAEWKDVTAGLKMVTDELRNEYDDLPTQPIELSGASLDAAIARELARLADGGETPDADEITGTKSAGDA